MATATIRISCRSCSVDAAADASRPDNTCGTRTTLRWQTSSYRCWMHSALQWNGSPTAPARYRECWLSMRRLAAVAICFAVSVLSLPAADLSGIWLGSIAGGGRRNQVQDVTFQFVQKGNILTGKLYVDYGSV